MYNIEELNKKNKEELKEIAQSLNIPKISAMKKSDLINAIAEIKTESENKKRERPQNVEEMTGILEVKADGYGFLRLDNFAASTNDIYVSPTQIRRFNLKTGDEITGDCRITDEEGKSSPLLFVKKINGDAINVALKRRPFEKRIPVFPDERINLETDASEYATRLIDIISPIGKGQRGMIVAPPKAGKTTIIKSLANAIRKSNPEIKLIILLIDERPEEVTDIKKSIDCDVIYSTLSDSYNCTSILEPNKLLCAVPSVADVDI